MEAAQEQQIHWIRFTGLANVPRHPPESGEKVMSDLFLITDGQVRKMNRDAGEIVTAHTQSHRDRPSGFFVLGLFEVKNI